MTSTGRHSKTILFQQRCHL
ncbi:hypothetical protein M5689_014941 [Euphorbia peplus]|nr:hypothetical protein M5689_014941 [Euphorbia peplus]